MRHSFFKNTNKSSIDHDYPPLKEGVVHYFNKRENFLLTMMFCAKFEIGSVVLEKKSRKCNFFFTNEQTERETNIQTDRQTDAEQKVIGKAHLSLA